MEDVMLHGVIRAAHAVLASIERKADTVTSILARAVLLEERLAQETDRGDPASAVRYRIVRDARVGDTRRRFMCMIACAKELRQCVDDLESGRRVPDVTTANVITAQLTALCACNTDGTMISVQEICSLVGEYDRPLPSYLVIE